MKMPWPPHEAGTVPALLDVLCPMHVILRATGHIDHAGPAFAKLLGAEAPPAGRRLLDLLELRRPSTEASMAGLMAQAGRKLHFALRNPPRTELKGVIVPLPAAPVAQAKGGAVLNLSFGISIVDAVRDYALTGADFAVTDLAVEMLYLVEAQGAVMEELRRLNMRIDGARAVAEAQATTDALTGLGNRRVLDTVVAPLIGSEQGFALMHLDLDFFKEVNDRFGHAAGDHVLRVASERLVACTRLQDSVLRVGGDEFLIILPGMTQAARIEEIASHMIASLSQPISYRSHQLGISASIGTAIAEAGSAPDIGRLISQADTALYAVKEGGRSAHLIYADELGLMGAQAAFTPPAG